MNVTDHAADAALLVEALIAVPPGGIITFDELTAALGRNIKEARWPLRKAFPAAEKDHGAVFSNVLRVGYQRLTTEQLANVGATARGSIRRKASKAVEAIQNGLSRSNDLSSEKTRKVYAELSVLGLLDHIAQDHAATPAEVHGGRPEAVTETAARLLAEINRRP